MAAKKSNEAAAAASRRRGWDVFLSFRGADTRKNFTDHLFRSLRDAEINVFIDDNGLPRGENISSELFEAIKGSKISVIIFSTNYAASSWCLEELVKIMEFRRSAQQVVLPIFYMVDPSDVRKQTGNFAEAFVQHEKRFPADKAKVLRWRNALTEAANLTGFCCTIHCREGKFIKKIVKEILQRLKNEYQYVGKYPVGLNSHVQNLDSLLSVGSFDVRIIGIYAMGGMGKTTVAKAIYNHLFHYFEHKCFLSDVRRSSEQPNGLVHLQEKLLSDILKTKNIEVSNVARGVNVIKERLCSKRVLIVLDDVDQLEQLTSLAGMHGWVGFGSRIIVTTRDMDLLKWMDGAYNVKELNDVESLQLFSWHAFGRSHPKEDYVKLSKDVIAYCKGLPLALEVLGSSLFGKSADYWVDALNKLKSIPNNIIHNTLKISYDALEDYTKKAIFLDVACFFIGEDKDYVLAILDGCGFFARSGISDLISRCLLSIDKDNKLMMHDLLRDMGREIVHEGSRQGSLVKLGNCSRLWRKEDVLKVLRMQHKGTEAVEGLILKFPTSNGEHLSTEAFAEMRNLRVLQLNNVHLVGSYDHFSKELKWICWHGFPLQFIPNDFPLENVVAIDMQYSNLKQVWKEIKVLEKLKVLNLSHSHHLTETPNFSLLTNLEKLELADCTSLVEVHPSIGDLHRLVLLNMKDCKQLKNLPASICMLKSLEIFNLSGCSKLKELLKDHGEMEALIELPTRKNPNSIILLPASLQGLSSLTKLILNNCNLQDETIPKDLTSLLSLEYFDLGSNNFHSLPAGISNLSKLWYLNLDNCTRLLSLPELPSGLNILCATKCISLEKLPDMSSLQEISSLFLRYCKKLVEIPGLMNLKFTPSLYLDGCDNLASTFKATLIQVRPTFVGNGDGIFLNGNEIPGWFYFQCMGSRVLFVGPSALGPFGNERTMVDVCVVYCFKKNMFLDRMWVGRLGDFPLTKSDVVDVMVHPHDDDGIYVKKCGVHLGLSTVHFGAATNGMAIVGPRERHDVPPTYTKKYKLLYFDVTLSIRKIVPYGFNFPPRSNFTTTYFGTVPPARGSTIKITVGKKQPEMKR